MISFTVPGRQVSTNAAYRKRGRGFGLYMTPEAKLWTGSLMLAGRLARRGQATLTCPVEVSIAYWFDSRKPDVDGPTKMVLDALQKAGIVQNDRQVHAYRVNKFLDKDAPRTTVHVRPYALVEFVATAEQLYDAFDDGLTLGIRKGG